VGWEYAAGSVGNVVAADFIASASARRSIANRKFKKWI
jgi:hypothetical protein